MAGEYEALLYRARALRSNGDPHNEGCYAVATDSLVSEVLVHAVGRAIVSAGCGSGLLEQLVRLKAPDTSILGVELPSCNVRWLPKTHIRRIPTFRDCYPTAPDEVLLLCCPVKQDHYLRSEQTKARKIILVEAPELECFPSGADLQKHCARLGWSYQTRTTADGNIIHVGTRRE